jgi:hypothetical protein
MLLSLLLIRTEHISFRALLNFEWVIGHFLRSQAL